MFPRSRIATVAKCPKKWSIFLRLDKLIWDILMPNVEGLVFRNGGSMPFWGSVGTLIDFPNVLGPSAPLASWHSADSPHFEVPLAKLKSVTSVKRRRTLKTLKSTHVSNWRRVSETRRPLPASPPRNWPTLCLICSVHSDRGRLHVQGRLSEQTDADHQGRRHERGGGFCT